MRSVFTAVCLFMVSTVAFSQQTTGGIFGLVSDRVAHLVASAPIEARNVDTGVTFKTDSSETGLYRLNGLPPGTYEISVSVTGAGNFVQQRISRTFAVGPNFGLNLDGSRS